MKTTVQKVFGLIMLTGLIITSQVHAQEFVLKNFPLDENLTLGEICIDSGTVWVATNRGAVRLVNQEWVVYDETNSLSVDSVQHIVRDEQGVVWFMGTHGLTSLKNNQFTKYYADQYDYSGTLDVTPGFLWLKYDTDGLRKISLTDTLQINIPSSVRGIEQDHLGNHWAFNSQESYYDLNNTNTWTVDTSLWILDFHIDHEGNKWIVSNGAILFRSFDSGVYEQLEIPFEGPSFTCITSDLDGNVYFGTWGEGVIIKTKTGWLNLNTFNGLLNNVVNDLAVDHLGNVWIAVSSYVDGQLVSALQMIQGRDAGLNALRGVIYADINNDGIQNEGEPGIPNQFIELEGEGAYALTDKDGAFSFTPTAGENTISVLLKDFWEQGVSPLSYTFTYPDETPEFSIGLKWKEVHDISVSIVNNAARPGFNTNYYIQIRNEGSVAEDIEVTLQHDELLSFISSTEEPTTSSANSLVWNFNAVPALSGKTINLMFNLPASVALNTILKSKATLNTVGGETETDDNIDSVEVVVTGSFDPNDKLVREGILEERFVELGTALTYTIRFQNTGTDTAFVVKIHDNLDPHFDLTSLKILAASHPMTTYLDDRTIKFTFPDILLPDSTRDEPASHGFVTYSIKPLTATLNNTVVQNSAAIYFDFNDAVMTNEVFNTYVTELPPVDEVLSTEDDLAGKLLYPNPLTSQTLYLHQNTKGFQRAALVSVNGAILQQFNLRENDGPLQLPALPAGVYLMKFTSAQRIVVERLIIRQ